MRKRIDGLTQHQLEYSYYNKAAVWELSLISTMQAFSHWLRFGGVIVNILWTTVWFVIN